MIGRWKIIWKDEQNNDLLFHFDTRGKTLNTNMWPNVFPNLVEDIFFSICKGIAPFIAHSISNFNLSQI
jgi:hypothetical protein